MPTQGCRLTSRSHIMAAHGTRRSDGGRRTSWSAEVWGGPRSNIHGSTKYCIIMFNAMYSVILYVFGVTITVLGGVVWRAQFLSIKR